MAGLDHQSDDKKFWMLQTSVNTEIDDLPGMTTPVTPGPSNIQSQKHRRIWGFRGFSIESGVTIVGN